MRIYKSEVVGPLRPGTDTGAECNVRQAAGGSQNLGFRQLSLVLGMLNTTRAETG